jgi:hypothetical protein
VPNLNPISIEEPILTGELSLGSLASYQEQERLTPSFDAPPPDDGAGEVLEDLPMDDVPLEASLAE